MKQIFRSLQFAATSLITTSILIAINIFVCLNFLLANKLSAQEVKPYKLSDKAYGLAYDGTNFWYVDSDRRALIKINENNSQEVYNLGIPNLKGIHFDGKEGRILVTAPRMILKVDPTSGGVTDRINIALTNVGGITTVVNNYYLLDVESGKVHILEKSSNLLIGAFVTDRAKPKDMCFGRDSLWVTDSSDGTVYRYDIRTGLITGSIKSPSKNIRGVVVSGGKLWVVDQDAKEVKNLPFIETDRFLASGESFFNAEVTVTYTIPAIQLSRSSVAILYPPTTEQQRIRGVAVKTKDFREGFIGANRVLIKDFTVEDQAGEKSTTYSFGVRTQSLRYFVNDEFMKKNAAFPSDIEQYRDTSKENIQWKVPDYISFLQNLFSSTSDLEKIFDKSKAIGMGVQETLEWDQTTNEAKNGLNLFLPSFGWVPVSNQKTKSINARVYENSDSTFIVYQSFDGNKLESPVFFRKDKLSPWVPIEAKISVKASKERE